MRCPCLVAAGNGCFACVRSLGLEQRWRLLLEVHQHPTRVRGGVFSSAVQSGGGEESGRLVATACQ